MKERVTAGKVWGIISPILIYTAITYAMTYLVMIILALIITASDTTLTQDIVRLRAIEGAKSQALMTMFCSALATIPVLVFLRYKDIQREKINGRFRKYKRISVLKYILIIPFGAFCMMAANYFVNLLVLFIPSLMTDSYVEAEKIIYGNGLLLQIVEAGIMGPIVEELIFRGLVYTRIKRMTKIIPAAIISSILFGIYHGNLVQAPYAFIIGMICVYLYDKYKAIAAPIIFHISANLLSIILTALLQGAGQTAVQPSRIMQMMACFVMIIITGALAFAVGVIINTLVKPKQINE